MARPEPFIARAAKVNPRRGKEFARRLTLQCLWPRGDRLETYQQMARSRAIPVWERGKTGLGYGPTLARSLAESDSFPSHLLHWE